MKKFLHFSVSIGYDEDSSSWSSGRGESNIRFEIPEEMYNGSSFLKLVDEAIKEAKTNYPEAKRIADERDAQWKKEREERKAKEEAEKQSTVS